MEEIDSQDVTGGVGTETGTETSGEESSTDARAEWTIMLYMSGDNDLAHDCIRALTELKSVLAADPDRVHMIAQIDPEDPRMQTRRLVINKKKKKIQPEKKELPKLDETGQPQAATTAAEDESGHLDDDKVDLKPGDIPFPAIDDPGRPPRPIGVQPSVTAQSSDSGEVDMADPKTLFDFISRSQQDYPAKNYMLILDGHSAGIEEGFLLKDQNPPGSMSLADLKRVLEAVKTLPNINKPLDILGLDSCLMNMVEICYEFRGLAKIIVGSQGLVPGHGWPFAKIIAATNNMVGEMTDNYLASVIIEQYMDSYLENSVIGGLSVDVGALRVDGSIEVAAKIKDLAELLSGALDDRRVSDGVVLAHWRAQSFNGELYVDLWDFCGELMEHCDTYNIKENAEENTLDKISANCIAVQKAIDAMVVDSCFVGIEYQHAHGLSIYFPWSEIFLDYPKLDFAKTDISGWSDFLRIYLDATRRETRFGEGFRMSESSIDRKDPPWKKDPPYQGPSERIYSMRNPPRDYPKNINCVADAKKLNQFLETFSIQ